MDIFKKKQGKLSRRITWRVILIVSFINVLIIGAILFFGFIISTMISGMRASYVIDGLNRQFESMHRAVEVASRNNAAVIENNLDSPEQVFQTLERELRLNKNYIDCFAAFEPDYFKSQGRWFEAYAHFTDSTNVELLQLGSEHHDYFNGVWYQKAMALGRDSLGYITDPYFDDSVESNIYCSYVRPLFDRQGRKVGVYGIDLNMSWLHQTIEEMEKTIWKEFYEDPSHDTKTNDDKDEREIGFSIQIIDSQGKCIAGTDSIDLSILKGEQNVVLSEYNMMDLKGTPYYIITQTIPHTDWKLVVFQHYNMVFLWGKVLAIVILFFMALGAVIIFFFTRHSIRRATKPLGILSDTAKEVAKGNFDTALPTFKRHDEISQLRDSFDTMQHSLSRYVEELKASTAAKASIESELNVAHSIQMSMLPKTFPAFPNRKDIDLYGSLTPAKGVGGDLFDFFIRDERLFFCVGDVSGKGVPAALVMAVTRTLFRNVAAHTDSPAQIVETMNVNISEGNDNQMFVTLFVGVLDLATGRLSYCNGGHNAPYIQSASLPVEPNLPIGIFPDWEFVEQETVMEPGSTIFLYTDGLTEAENAVQDQFGEDRMTAILAAQTEQSASPDTLISVMTDAVHEFVGDTEQSDDLTMLAIKYTKI